jgi:hypothetical protein
MCFDLIRETDLKIWIKKEKGMFKDLRTVEGFSFTKAVKGKLGLLLGQMVITVYSETHQEKISVNSLIEFT